MLLLFPTADLARALACVCPSVDDAREVVLPSGRPLSSQLASSTLPPAWRDYDDL